MLLALLVVPAFSAFGQRTMKGQIFAEMAGCWTPGATLGAGGYTISGYWCAGAEGLLMRRSLAMGGEAMAEHLDIYHLKARGGYMYRFVGTRSRAVNLYGGGEAWVGLETLDPFHTMPDDIVLSIDDGNSFVFGVTPRLEAEFFLGNHFAIVLGGRVPVAFLSRLRMFNYQGTVGFRIAF